MDISFKFAEQKSILCIARVFIFIMQLLTRFFKGGGTLWIL